MNTLFKGLSPLFDCQNVIYGGGIRGREGVAPGIGGNVGRSYQKLSALPSGMMLISLVHYIVVPTYTSWYIN